MSYEKQRAGLIEVAALSGVSLSTVDRVLNERGSVSDSKRRKVLEAARQLGLRRLLPSPVHGLLRFDLLMVESSTDHFIRLAQAFTHQASILRERIVLQRHTWQERDPQQLLSFINEPMTRRQGLIVVTHDTPQIRLALQRQIEQGVPVVLVTSSLSGLQGATYAGIDNLMAGRTAGRLMSQWLHAPGRVLLVTNSLLYEAHRQRVQGFQEVMQRQAPNLEIIGPVECFDDVGLNSLAVHEALHGQVELVGLYSTGSGSAGFRKALLDTGARPVWISHEATEQHAGFLREGLLSLVLDQDPEGQAEAAIQHLLYANGDVEAPAKAGPQLRIVIEENLPVESFDVNASKL